MKIRVLVLSDIHQSDVALRYRIKFLLDLINDKNLTIKYFSFYSSKSQKIMQSDSTLLKIMIFFYQIVLYIFKFIRLRKSFDIVIVKNYCIPLGNFYFEKLIFKYIKTKKIIYDIDDGIYLNQTSEFNNKFSLLRNAKSKVYFWTSYSSRILVSNPIIKDDLITIFNVNRNKIKYLVSLPFKYQYFKEGIEIEKFKKSEFVNFIWLGSPHTQNNLYLCESLIIQISKVINNSRVFIIGVTKEFKFNSNYNNVYFIPWSIENELKYMRISHFGLNPLINSEFERRKSAFKVFQYFRAGIVPIVSDVGINRRLILNYFGYTCNDFEHEALTICNYISNVIEKDIINISMSIYEMTNKLSAESNIKIYLEEFNE